MASEPVPVADTTEIVPVNILNPYPHNPRKGDVDAIAASLRVNGQYTPIIVNIGGKTGRPFEVLAGNHTLKAFQQLRELDPFSQAWAVIKVHWVDEDEEGAKRIVLADNQTFKLGEGVDQAVLRDILNEIGTTGTGYADADLDALDAALARAEPTESTDPDPEPDPPDLVPHEASVIGYTLTFDDEEQQEQWFEFMKTLKLTYPDLETGGERLLAHLAETESERV